MGVFGALRRPAWMAPLAALNVWQKKGGREIFGTLGDSSISATTRRFAFALLLWVAAVQACAEGEGLDGSMLHSRDGGSKAGAAGGPSGPSNSGSGGADTSGSGGAPGSGGVQTDASAGASGGGNPGVGGASGSGGSGGAAGAAGAAGSKDAGAAGAGGTGGSSIVSDAGASCDYSTAPVYALIANQGNGGPNPTDGVIQFDLKLVNTTANSIALNSFKVRYYFTDENAGASTMTNFFSKIDGATYMAIDASKIYIMRYDLVPAKTGANAYLEFTFDAALGSLPANDYVWVRAQFHHNDYRVFNENDDFSYLSSNSPADEGAWEACKNEPACPTFANCKTVVLQNSTVVFGTPP
jgi:Cellulose binding domain